MREQQNPSQCFANYLDVLEEKFISEYNELHKQIPVITPHDFSTLLFVLSSTVERQLRLGPPELSELFHKYFPLPEGWLS
jgi:hypothetical protein